MQTKNVLFSFASANEQSIKYALSSNCKSFLLDSGAFTFLNTAKRVNFDSYVDRYIEFINRDENIDFDTKMKGLQAELTELLVQEEKSKADLLSVFKELGYEIKL